METTPIYFQTSGYELGYVIPPGENAPVAYSPENVDRYVNGEYVVLWQGEPKPGARFLGVFQANGEYLGLLYMPQYDPYFTRPAGDSQGQGSANGEVQFERLVTSFPGLLRGAIGLDRSRPFFSIVDSNAAHHVSAALARYAFDTWSVDDHRTRVIFNFDHHQDYGAGGGVQLSSPISCQRWGQFTVATFDTWRRSIASAYAVIGVERDLLQYKPSPPTGLGLRKVQKVGIASQVDQLLQDLGVGVEMVDFHVTVDRDFMQGSFTTYGDGIYGADEGRQMVHELLTRMGGARLVGFDLVGLPTVGGQSAARPEYENNQGCMKANEGCPWRQARDDIIAFLHMVQDFPTAVAAERATTSR